MKMCRSQQKQGENKTSKRNSNKNSETRKSCKTLLEKTKKIEEPQIHASVKNKPDKNC